MEEDSIQTDVTNTPVLINEVNNIQYASQINYDDQIPNTTEESSLSKRIRDQDISEKWTNVVRKAKRRTANTNSEEQTEICVTSKNTLPKQFALAKLFKDHNITDITKVKYVNPYKIILQFNNKSSAEHFISLPEFSSKLGWRCLKSYEVGLSYGIIRNIDLGLTEDEIMKNMTSDCEIVSLKRQSRRNSEELGWTESEAVRICFKGPSLPSYVYLFELRVKVDPYTFPVSQCSKCWRFGHTQKVCPKRITCPKCAGNHGNCVTTSFNCRNCSGNHMAMDKSCPVFEKEKKVRDIMTEYNCTYKRAAEIYAPSVPFNFNINGEFPPISPRSPVLPVPPSSKQNPERIPYNQILTTQAQVHKNPESSTSIPRKHKTKQKNNRQGPPRGVDFEMEYSSDDSTNNLNTEDQASSKPRTKERRKNACGSSWCELLKKLKDIIFLKSISITEKFKSILQVCLEFIISFCANHICDISVLRSFFNNFNG